MARRQPQDGAWQPQQPPRADVHRVLALLDISNDVADEACGCSFKDLGKTFRFQAGTIDVAKERVQHLLSNRLMGLVSFNPDSAYMDEQQRQDLHTRLKQHVEDVVEGMRVELLFNYRAWCKTVDERPVAALGRAMDQVALYYLIYTEAAHARFCPEFLCFVFHKLAEVGNKKHDLDGGFFYRHIAQALFEKAKLQEQEELQDSKRDNATVNNYDDLNELFWRKETVADARKHALAGAFRDALEKAKKTFHERRTWLMPCISFWKVITLHVVALHALIVVGQCADESSFPCTMRFRSRPVLSLACLIAFFDFLDLAFHSLCSSASLRSWYLGFCRVLRFVLKLAAAGGLWYKLHSWGSPADAGKLFYLMFGYVVTLLALELFVHASKLRCLDCVPGLSVLMGEDSRVLHTRLQNGFSRHFPFYAIFWVILFAVKLTSSYYTVIAQILTFCRRLWRNQETTVLVLPFDHKSVEIDHRGVTLDVVLCVPALVMYFLDTQIWFCLFASIWAAAVGWYRKAGSVMKSAAICGNLAVNLPKVVSPHLADPRPLRQSAVIWNEVVRVMREEDKMDDRAASAMQYLMFADDMALPRNLMFDDIVRMEPAFTCHGHVPRFREDCETGGHARLIKRINEETEPFHIAHSQLLYLAGLVARRLADPTLSNERFCTVWSKLYERFMPSSTAVEEGTTCPVLYRWPRILSKLGALVKGWVAGSVDRAKLCHEYLQELDEVATDLTDQRLRCGGGQANAEQKDPGEEAVPLEILARLKWLLDEELVEEDLMSDEAKERFKFFVRSLQSPTMPSAKPTYQAPPCSTLTPHYEETIISSPKDLISMNSQGLRELEYLALVVYPSEWKFFIERMGRKQKAWVQLLEDLETHVDERYFHQFAREQDVPDPWPEDLVLEVRLWASYRAQTLARTVRGLAYTHEAIRLLVEAQCDDLFKSRVTPTRVCEGVEMRVWDMSVERGLVGKKLADHKYAHVIASQKYPLLDAEMRADMELLLRKYSHLKVAYLESELSRPTDEEEPSVQYYSVLLHHPANDEPDGQRANESKDCEDRARAGGGGACDGATNGGVASSSDNGGQPTNGNRVLRKIQLPGSGKKGVIVGEGKPNNQNQGLIWVTGEAVQAIDANQDGYLEEALKVPNLLQEFDFDAWRSKKNNDREPPRYPRYGRIVGCREYVYTKNISAAATFMFLQESNFVIATQRVLDVPLDCRFHYGHPDWFCLVSAVTMGGISKASKGINLSEDIFGGYNFVLRGGRSTQADYIRYGKGRDVDLTQIAKFNSKISQGNCEQSLSRDVYRLAQTFDLPRCLTFFYSSVGFFMNQAVLMAAVYALLYCRLILSFMTVDSWVIQDVLRRAVHYVMESSIYYFVMFGALQLVPFMLFLWQDRGVRRMLEDLVFNICRRFGPLFFAFQTAIQGYHYQCVMTFGGASYIGTGRGFVIDHIDMIKSFNAYYDSHFLPAGEFLVVLLVPSMFTRVETSLSAMYMIWLLIATLLWAPHLYSPFGFDFAVLASSAKRCFAWIFKRYAEGTDSWEVTTWKKRNEAIAQTTWQARVTLVLYQARYFLLSWAFAKAATLHADPGQTETIYSAIICTGVVFPVFCLLLLNYQPWCVGRPCLMRLVGHAEVKRRAIVRAVTVISVFAALAAVMIALACTHKASGPQMFAVYAAIGFFSYTFVQMLRYTFPGWVVKENYVWYELVFRGDQMIATLVAGLVALPAVIGLITHAQHVIQFNSKFIARLDAIVRQRTGGRSGPVLPR